HDEAPSILELAQDYRPFDHVAHPVSVPADLLRRLCDHILSVPSATTTSTTANPAGRQSQELSEIKPDGHQERSEQAGEEGVASRELGRRDHVLSGCPERGPCTSGVEAGREKLTAQGGGGASVPSAKRRSIDPINRMEIDVAAT